MNKGIPIMNKICFQKNLERDRKIHFEKILSMKSSIDKSPPQAYEFLTNRKKKEQQQESRMTEIERENKILLSKITGIMQKGNLRRSQTSTVLQQSVMKKSLNGESRKRDLVKIVIENQAILKRIQEKKSAYDIKKWERDREQTEKYIANTCQYQYKDFKNKTFIKLGLWNDSPSQMSKKQQTCKLEPLQQSQTSFQMNGKKNILFSKARKVGLEYYFVKIYTSGGQFVINLQNLENGSQTYNCTYPENEGLKILKKDCQNDPEKLIEKLIVDDKAKRVHIRKEIIEPAMNVNNQDQPQIIENQEEDESKIEHQKSQQNVKNEEKHLNQQPELNQLDQKQNQDQEQNDVKANQPQQEILDKDNSKNNNEEQQLQHKENEQLQIIENPEKKENDINEQIIDQANEEIKQ